MKKIKLILIVLILITLTLSVAVSNAYAKYVAKENINGSLTVTAELGNISVEEADVSTLIIPGVDINVDHSVKISNKSPISAYVYLVVETNILEAHNISFEPSSSWKKISGVESGNRATTVYVYADSHGAPVAVDNEVTGDNDFLIPINGVLEVSQYVNNSVPESVDIKFTALMYQTAAGSDASEVYENYN